MWLLQRRDEVGARMSSGALRLSRETESKKWDRLHSGGSPPRKKVGFVKKREMISRRAHAS